MFLLMWAVARFGGWFQVHDVRVIFVNGDRLRYKGYVSPAEVRNLTGLSDGYNILRLDRERIRARLKRHVWIKDARIKVSLKGVVKIYVEAREPVGRVEGAGGKGYLVDAEGIILGEATQGYPLVSGLDLPSEAEAVPGWVAGLLSYYARFTRCIQVFPRIDVHDPEAVRLLPLEGDRPRAELGPVDNFYAIVPRLEELLSAVDPSRFAVIDCRLGYGCVLKPLAEGGRESG